MKSLFRPAVFSDLPAVIEFLSRAFETPRDAPFLNPALMAWKYWEPRADFDAPRAYVLERDRAITAFVGLLPLTIAGARGVHMIDWASSREAPGAGLALVQRLAAMFDFILAIGGSGMTRTVLPGFGFATCASQWNGARPLRPFRQIRTHQYRNWKLAPRLLRNARWAALGHRVPEGWTCQKAPAAGLSSVTRCFTACEPAFFEYLERCPTTRVRSYSIRQGGQSQGHLAIGVLRGQARLAGVWLREPSQSAFQASFALAIQAAAGLDEANEIVAAGTQGLSESAAVQAGFRIVRHTPVYLLNKKGKLELPTDFQFQLADYDGLYLDDGTPGYWT